MNSSTPKFDVICPLCEQRATGHTLKDGVWGSYRESYKKYKIEHVTCSHCGKITSNLKKQPKLWFYTEINGLPIWERNEVDLRGLYEFFLHDSPDHQYYRDYLPRKLIMEPTRSKVVRWLKSMVEGNS